MSNEANIWQPRKILELSGDTKSVEELIVAQANQTLFSLTTFAYVLNTGALEVHKNGLLLTKDKDWVEQSDTTFVLLNPSLEGDQVVATGKVGITGNVDVRDTDIFISNLQALRDYTGTEVTAYVQGGVTRADGKESMFNKVPTPSAPGTYVDNNVGVIVPTGGDGSVAWLKERVGGLVVSAVDLSAAVALISLKVNDTVQIAERIIGNGGSSLWKCVLASSVTVNTFNIVACTGVPTLALVLLDKPSTRNLGVPVDGTDVTAICTSIAALGLEVTIDAGTYLLSAPVLGNWVSFSSFEISSVGYFDTLATDSPTQINKNIRIGNETLEPNTSAKRDAIIVNRRLVGATDCHAVADRTVIVGVTDAGTYGTFDATTDLNNDGTQSHLFAFQNRNNANLTGGGTINNFAGFIHWPTASNGTIVNNFGIEIKDVESLGTTVVENNLGIGIENLSATTTNIGLRLDQANAATPSWSIYAGGGASMYHQGTISVGGQPTDATTFNYEFVKAGTRGALYAGSSGVNLLVNGDKSISFLSNAAVVGQFKPSASFSNAFTPGTDNLQPLGDAINRWSVVFAGSGTINTSDEREKTELLSISATEKKVALEIKAVISKFLFKEAVDKKGGEARIHFGVGAQAVGSIFEANNLDPNDYAVFCYDEWEEGNRYGIRYDELAMFILAAL